MVIGFTRKQAEYLQELVEQHQTGNLMALGLLHRHEDAKREHLEMLVEATEMGSGLMSAVRKGIKDSGK